MLKFGYACNLKIAFHALVIAYYYITERRKGFKKEENGFGIGKIERND